MAISLTVSLLSASTPKPVQLSLSGMTSGQDYEVTGSTSDGSTWAIPGGVGTSDGSTLLLIDNRAALNSAITYHAVVDGTTHSAAPITVSYEKSGGVLQSLDGRTLASVQVASLNEPRKGGVRAKVYEIAGRKYPAVRLDIAASYEYSWEVDTTTDTDGAALLGILASGVPVVRRLPSGVRDLKTVVLGVVTDWSDALLTNGSDVIRRWSLTVREIGDPEPNAILTAYDWDDFDAVFAARTWTNFDTFWSTWNLFDSQDWATLE